MRHRCLRDLSAQLWRTREFLSANYPRLKYTHNRKPLVIIRVTTCYDNCIPTYLPYPTFWHFISTFRPLAWHSGFIFLVATDNPTRYWLGLPSFAPWYCRPAADCLLAALPLFQSVVGRAGYCSCSTRQNCNPRDIAALTNQNDPSAAPSQLQERTLWLRRIRLILATPPPPVESPASQAARG